VWWPGILSTTLDKDLKWKCDGLTPNVLWVITIAKRSAGVDIKGSSAFGHEEEVVFAPFSKFLIDEVDYPSKQNGNMLTFHVSEIQVHFPVSLRNPKVAGIKSSLAENVAAISAFGDKLITTKQSQFKKDRRNLCYSLPNC